MTDRMFPPEHTRECAETIWRNKPFSVGLGWNQKAPECTCDFRERNAEYFEFARAELAKIEARPRRKARR